MALQMVRSFFGQGTPSRSRVHEPVIGSESFGNQEGNSSYDRGDVGKSAASNWFELARHPTSELGRKPHRSRKSTIFYHLCKAVACPGMPTRGHAVLDYRRKVYCRQLLLLYLL